MAMLGLRGIAGALLAAAVVACQAPADPVGALAGQAGPVRRSDQFQAVAGNGTTLVVVGAFGAVLSSSDNGRTWAREELPGKPPLIAVSACPDGSYAALDFYRKVWLGDRAAKQWQAKELKTRANPLALACDPRGRIWVVGSNSTILASRDRGATWQETSLGEDAMLTTIQFLDGEHAVISGEFGLFLTTADGGAHWVPGTRISDDFYPYAALFSDPSTGSVSGLGGVIVHTVDGGRTWTRELNRTGAPMYGVVGHGGETWALGVNGLVLKRTQREWMPTAQGLPAPWLRAGRSLGPTAMLVAGGAGTLQIVSTASVASGTGN